MRDETRTPLGLGGPDAIEAGSGAPGKAALWGYREILALIAVGILAQILAAVGALTVAQQVAGIDGDAFGELLQREPGVAVPVQLVAWLPVLLFIGLVVRVHYGLGLRPGLSWLPLRRPIRSYLRTGMLLAFASALASFAISDPAQESPMKLMLENRDSLWILALYGVVLAPCLEEAVFRGFLFAALERYHGSWAALLGSSAVFAVLHGSQYGWRWQQLAVLMAVGCAFGAIRIQSGSAKASAVVHATYNATLFVAVIAMPAAVG